MLAGLSNSLLQHNGPWNRYGQRLLPLPLLRLEMHSTVVSMICRRLSRCMWSVVASRTGAAVDQQSNDAKAASIKDGSLLLANAL